MISSNPSCPQCGDNRVVTFSSTRRAICSGCGLYFDWPLKENQPPTVTNNRDKRGQSKYGK